MHFELITLTGTKFSGDVRQVNLATTEGELGILPHHERLTAVAVAGPVTIVTSKAAPQVFAVYGGLLEVDNDVTRLLADEAEHAEDLIVGQVEAALVQAKQMKTEAKDKHEIDRAQAMIDRQMVRLGVAKMRRHH